MIANFFRELSFWNVIERIIILRIYKSDSAQSRVGANVSLSVQEKPSIILNFNGVII